MVATEKDRSHIARPPRPQALDHLSGLWAAIDEVAQKDDHVLRPTARGNIGLNLGEHFVKEIEPAVDISNGVRAITCCALR